MPSNKNLYRDHLLRALEHVRGEIAQDTAPLLVLTIYGLRLMADPTSPDQRLRVAAQEAWNEIIGSDAYSSHLNALRQGVQRVFSAAFMETPAVAPTRGARESARELIEGVDLGSGRLVAGAFLKLTNLAQQLQPFVSLEERQAFAAELTHVTLGTNTQHRSALLDAHSSRSELTSVLVDIAQAFASKPPRDIYDPTAGTGGTLLKAAQAFHPAAIEPPAQVYGQDVNRAALYACAWRLIIHDIRGIQLEVASSLEKPVLLDEGTKRPKRFDLVVANPPMGFKPHRLDRMAIESDQFGRFQFGPTPSVADWLFAQHALASTQPDGLAITTIAPGALFRSGLAEATIRKSLVVRDNIAAVVLLPAGMSLGTSLQSAVLVLEAKKPEERRNRTVFVDGSNMAISDELLEAVRRALSGVRAGPSERAFAEVSTEMILEQGGGLLPTSHLPPPNIRASLLTVAKAQEQMHEAHAELLAAHKLFIKALKLPPSNDQAKPMESQLEEESANRED